jgi:hypothetical protein
MAFEDTDCKETVIKNKLIKILNDTLECDDWKYDGKIEEVNCFSLLCEMLSDDNRSHKMLGSIMTMFNCFYQECKSVLMFFSIHNASDDKSAKNMSEKIIEIARNLENTFITIDFLNTTEVKEEKYVYIVAVKKI